MPTIPSPDKPGLSPLSPAPSSPFKNNSPAPSILPNLVDNNTKKINL